MVMQLTSDYDGSVMATIQQDVIGIDDINLWGLWSTPSQGTDTTVSISDDVKTFHQYHFSVQVITNDDGSTYNQRYIVSDNDVNLPPLSPPVI